MPFYPTAIDGEWFSIKRLRGFTLVCCDCGLAHSVDFKIKGPRTLWMRAYRKTKATSDFRRRRVFLCKKVTS